jgi:hypothetical protein
MSVPIMVTISWPMTMMVRVYWTTRRATPPCTAVYYTNKSLSQPDTSRKTVARAWGANQQSHSNVDYTVEQHGNLSTVDRVGLGDRHLAVSHRRLVAIRWPESGLYPPWVTPILSQHPRLLAGPCKSSSRCHWQYGSATGCLALPHTAAGCVADNQEATIRCPKCNKVQYLVEPSGHKHSLQSTIPG